MRAVGLSAFLLASIPASLQATDVSGTISANTTWGLAGSPYNLVGYTRVNYGATLTIDPGVLVIGNGNKIQTSGTLAANGNSSAMIVFTNVLVMVGTNTNYSQPFSIIIRNAHLVGCSVYNTTPNPGRGTLTMEDCQIESPTTYFYLWYPTGDCLIKRNIFSGTVPNYALFSVGTSGTNRVFIQDNVFYQTGVAVQNWASYDTSLTLVTGNSFLRANYPTLVLPSRYTGANMIATNNYWGTVDTNVINQMIFDKNDAADSANYISYMPFLTAPNPNTAQVPPPNIQVQPQDQTAIAGGTASFSVQATGLGLNYQWQTGGTNLPGKTNSTLVLSSVSPAQAGTYSVTIGDAAGQSTPSSAATLTVNCLLNVAATTGGSVTRNPDLPAYPAGSLVAVTATPAVGYGFIRWTGNAAGSTNPLAVSMDTNKNITAVFASTALTLASQGVGTISKVPDQPFYAVGDQVALSATPGRWHAFSRWTDGNTSNPRLVTIGEMNVYTAVFTPTTPLETVTIGGVSRLAPVGMPVVVVDGVFILTPSASARGSATVTLSTTFPGGWLFYTLDGADPAASGALYTGQFTVGKTSMLRTIGYNAAFTHSVAGDPLTIVLLPTLTRLTGGGGSVAIEPLAGAYFSNALAVVTATPAPGWTFLQWLGDATGTNPTVSVSMTRNRTVRAVFGTVLNTTVAGGGSIVSSPVSPWYPYGSQVRLTAIPATGNYLAFWANAAAGRTNNPLTFTITNANPQVTAVFASLGGTQTNALTVIPDGRGQVTLTPPGNRFRLNTNVVLQATPDSGQEFLGWTGAASGSDNPLLVTMNSNKVIMASFTKRPRLQVGTVLEGLFDEVFRLTLVGEFGTSYSILGSTNLLDWASVGTVTNTYGTIQFTDPVATNSPYGFYRALSVGP